MARKTILAVDDQSEVLTVIEDILFDSYDVLVAKTPTRALGLLQKEAIDLILMDVQMPGINGIDLIEHLRKEAGPLGKIPVIFVTSEADKDTIQRALSRENREVVKGYVLKPLDPDDLKERIGEVFKGQGPGSP
jgi:CheY-like chemotaxis protein